MRTFVAITLPQEIRRELALAAGQVGDEGVRWVAEENIHLTLKFLGEIAKTDLPRVCEILCDAVRGERSFEMKVRGLGLMPNPARPRVVYAGVEADETLKRLAEKIDPAFEDLGVEADDRAFRPHVTIGRIRSRGRHRAGRQDLRELREAVLEREEQAFGRTVVSEIVLFESELGATGPTYTALSRVPLVAVDAADRPE
ncbi:MAG: RNA 2',3'-cyclic phosphodiesterase [Myxococcota bacterium]